MLILSSSDVLRVVLAGATTTNQAVLVASYLDAIDDLSAGTTGNTNGTTNSTTAVSWVGSPASGYKRQIKYASLHNADTTSIAATISVYDGVNARTTYKVALQTGETAIYVDSRGWQVYTADGTARTEAVGSVGPPCDFVVAVGDETTNITTGTAKTTFRATRAMSITKIKASLSTSPSSGNPAFDVNKNGASVFTTTVTIDSGEKTSETAATAAVLSGGTLTLAADDEITIDIDTAGTNAKGPKITFIGTF